MGKQEFAETAVFSDTIIFFRPYLGYLYRQVGQANTVPSQPSCPNAPKIKFKLSYDAMHMIHQLTNRSFLAHQIGIRHPTTVKALHIFVSGFYLPQPIYLHASLPVGFSL